MSLSYDHDIANAFHGIEKALEDVGFAGFENCLPQAVLDFVSL